MLTGQGRFSDDLSLPGQAHAFFLRSPEPHARIEEIDISAARAAPGVLAVLTAQDYDADGLPPIPAMRPTVIDRALGRPDGQPAFTTPIAPLAGDKVRRVGEALAMVVAETEAQAMDAAELIGVAYAPLAQVTDGRKALEPGAPLIWEDAPGNVCIDDQRGDAAATEAAFAGAHHVTSIEVMNNRVTGVPMEPRAAIGEYDQASGKLTLYAGSAAPVRHKNILCAMFGQAPEDLRVLCHQVGGGFGTRGRFYQEFPLVLWAARRLGQPVKWVCGRSEAFLSDDAARDQFTRVQLALNQDGKFLALRADHVANFGTHAASFTPLTRGISVTTGVYDIPVIHLRARAAFTNTNPIHTYRGAGRPEAMFLLERLIDNAAAEMNLDPVEIRRLNLIPPSAMPYANLTGMTYDSGEFAKSMDLALAKADWAGFEARRAEARARGRLRGIGLANYIETATGQPVERAEMEIQPEGRVQLVVGTQDSGQGHATSYAQLIREWLDVPIADVDLIEGDTDIVKKGSGSHSSRSMRLAGFLLGQARDEILDQGRRIAADMLEVAAADIGFAQGRFTVTGTDRSVGLFEVAAAAPEPLQAAAEIDKVLPAFPNGCHICELEVDPETGAVTIVRYTGIDDVGRVINPLLVDGQTQGGIAQGAGQALMENCDYDPASGQLIAGSFMDYAMPRADIFPFFDLACNEVMATNNPLGVKGAGEGGTTGAPPAIINALIDALRHLGIRHIDMPATPLAVWRAIRAAG